ncbi:MAG: GGDEF domain-containing protein [Planctomycetota bacterium]|nr:GGDEF domain-containing protein [Planctomycetota bacterium]
MNEKRATRGVIVFAGDFEEELVSGIEQPVQRVRTVFDAIGELATCTTSDPVEAVVINQELIATNPVAAIDGMRRVDPNTVVVVMCGEKETDHADACISEDTTSAKLTAAILNAKSSPPGKDFIDYIDLDTILGISDESMIVRDASSLGDVDLVRSIMHDPTSFKEVLINLLKQETGWSFCAIVDDSSCAPKTAKIAPLRYGHTEHGVLAAIGSSQNELTRWARWAACWLEMSRRQRQLKLLAYQDELSGAWNRRFLRTCFARELQIARDQRRPLTVMVFDIDDFKQYNDKWGHDAGDEIIREVVRLLRTIIRKGDHVCRIGGDEFAVLFCDPEPPREVGSNHPTTIEVLAKRFRQQVANARFPSLGEEATGILSISGGLATFPWDGMDVDSILQRADERLFQSKRQGKNSISIGQEV